MDKLKNRILRLLKKKYFIALIIMFVVIFAETSYRFIVKLDFYLAEAEEASTIRGVQIEDMELYKNHAKNKRVFDRKAQAIRKNVVIEDQFEVDEEVEKEKAEAVDIPKDTEFDNENKDAVQEEVDKDKVETPQEPEQEEATEKEGEVLPEEPSEENKKVAYLTFDDGPSKTVTPKILDLLAQYDIKATFFVVGKTAESNPDILKRTYEEGHVIGNHSYSHNYNYIYKNVTNFINELKITEEVFKNLLGQNYETDLIRFPGGSFGDWKSSFREQVIALGYRYIDWNSLNGDAEGHNLSRERLIERFKSTYHGQNELVILMHDTDAKPTTVEALPAIIEFLIEEGYDFGTF